MKLLKISILVLIISFIAGSCGHTDTESEGKNVQDPVKFEKVNVNECIKRIIYKRHSDIQKYDSISTHYFHEFEEYIEPEAIALQNELDKIKKLLSSKELLDASPYYHKMDSIRNELSPYHKFVVGYAFVHTFFDGKDTLSAIFVMDTMCGFGEMTLVKEKISDDPIDNSEYSEKFRKGNN